MADKKQKLELTWIGKDKRPRLEPRILLEDPELSYHAPKRVTENDIFDNMLVHGDNLLALKALEQEFAGKVKCAYIDPPFNTGQAFEHYEDGLEHSLWLSLMRDRIDVLHRMLSPDGTLAVHIDDNELAYLVAVLDEIFGRTNRVSIVTFKQSSVSGPKAVNPGLVTIANYVLLYSKDRALWRPNRVYVATQRDARYNQYIENPDEEHSRWRFTSLRSELALRRSCEVRQLKKLLGADLDQALEDLVLEDPKRVVRLARVQSKDINESARGALSQSLSEPGVVQCSAREDKADYYFLDGQQLLFYSSKAQFLDGRWVTGVPASNIWDDLLSNNLHNEGGVRLPKGKKPEKLLQRILDLATNDGDLVLDSFAGSGTTGAVAHKMRRRWIMVERGEQCHTHVLPRLHRVVDGTDDSGITSATKWSGGGGFRFLRLGPSLLSKDQWGNWIVSKEYRPEMLAEAVCKLEGFRYEPDPEVFWLHGRSTETDFIYVTTQNLSREQLQFISDQVGPGRTLLICCSAFRAKRDDFANLTLKKIPQAVLSRCEWGRDDYSLNVAALPPAEAVEEAIEGSGEESANGNPPGRPKKSKRRKKSAAMQELPLFDGVKDQDGGKR